MYDLLADLLTIWHRTIENHLSSKSVENWWEKISMSIYYERRNKRRHLKCKTNAFTRLVLLLNWHLVIWNSKTINLMSIFDSSSISTLYFVYLYHLRKQRETERDKRVMKKRKRIETSLVREYKFQVYLGVCVCVTFNCSDGKNGNKTK